MTGNVIGKIDLTNQMSFTEAAALASRYDRISGEHEVLYTLLESARPLKNKEQEVSIAETLSDPTRRDGVLKNLEETTPQP